MQNSWKLCVLLVGMTTSLSLFVGCGGGSLSQADMKRLAMKRSSGDEDEEDNSSSSKPTNNASATSSSNTQRSADQNAVGDSSKAGSNVGSSKDAKEAPATSVMQSADLPVPISKRERPTLTPEQQRQQSIDNLKKIGEAMNAYVADNGAYPASAVHLGIDPMLSWRVALLPYLGHQKLYDQFKLDEPWDSDDNYKLLERIPPVFAASHRFDEKSNYLVPVASGTLFFGPRATAPRRVTDEVKNTICVLEADDSLAAPWTKPQEFPLNYSNPTQGLGNLRGDGFFVVWGNGKVNRIDSKTSAARIKAAMTIDAGENFRSAQISRPARAQAEVANVANPLAANPTQAAAVARNAVSSSGSASGRRDVLGSGNTTTPSADIERTPVPSEKELTAAVELVKSIYGEQYKAAKKLKERQEISASMLKQANEIKEPSVDQYALLQMAYKTGLASAEVKVAQEASQRLYSYYDIDEFNQRFRTLERAAKLPEKANAAGYLKEEAGELLQWAVDEDEYQAAESILKIGITSARRTSDNKLMRDFVNAQRELKRLKRDYMEVESYVSTLDANPKDPEANLIAGKYYCFGKGRWDVGLPMLVRGNDLALQERSAEDMAMPLEASEQIQVADGWWEAANELKENHQQRNARIRAAQWYLAALQSLEAGLLKAKAEIRLKEIDRLYGKLAIDPLFEGQGTNRRQISRRSRRQQRRGGPYGGAPDDGEDGNDG